MKHLRPRIGKTTSVAVLAAVGLSIASNAAAGDRVCELITAAEASSAVGTSVSSRNLFSRRIRR
jgi:type IV secretory pathway protease TraF